ncbi:hypothetical protein [Amycolatopsis minnesotensis]|uniref:DUF4267 domain-containing protein n=1 Tax=Amycolatopsis minnesotensis TaxID=337894 RepID=A0ABN2QWH7_9PSEU
MPSASKVLGVLTAAYGAAVLVRPATLTTPLDLDRGRGVASSLAMLARAMGARDLAIGVAMAVAPAGKPATVAVGARVASDVGDAVIFGTGLAKRNLKVKAVTAASAWGALCAISLLGNRRR